MANFSSHTILMTADTLGGVWNYALILTKALQEYNVEVYLATMGKKLSPDQWNEAEALDNLTICESGFALEWMENPWGEIKEAGEWLLSLEQEIKPDIIHLNNYAHASLQWDAPVLTVGHSCVLSWWNAVHNKTAPAGWTTYMERVRSGLQHSDIVIGITQYMLDQLKKFYGPFTYSKVIYNAREHNPFQPAEKKEEIFCMGRLWDEAKNIQALQEIAPNLDWPVYLAGEDYGKFPSGVENLYSLGKLSSPQVANKLSEASIYVMPARYEPFGLSILEAALSGCGLVLGDIPTLRELWQDAALFANPDKPRQLQDQIQRLIQQPVLLKSMAEKAQHRAQKFSLQKMGSSYWEVYQELLQYSEIQSKNPQPV